MQKVQNIVAKKVNWEDFSRNDRRTMQNAVLIAQLLHRMCSVTLVLHEARADTIEKVNASEVERTIADAHSLMVQVKKGALVESLNSKSALMS